jgi:small subunit ribosomal protein S1
LKQLTPDPWEKIEEKYPIDSKHNGIVRNLTPFGAFVELEEGVDGLVHISDLSWTKKVRHPSEVVKKNQEIDVVVLDINKEERRIALGHKQVETNPWDTFEETYNVGIETTGTISRLIDKGVIVTLPLGVDSFVPLNHLGRSGLKRASDHFKVGDELPLKVIEFDKENKRIVLSVSEYLKGKEKAEVDGYNAAHNFIPTTMGELVKDVPEVLDGLPDEERGRERPAKKPKSKKTAEEKDAEAEAVIGDTVEEPLEEEKTAELEVPQVEQAEELVAEKKDTETDTSEDSEEKVVDKELAEDEKPPLEEKAEAVEKVESEPEVPATEVPQQTEPQQEEKESKPKKAAATKKKTKTAATTKKSTTKKTESAEKKTKKETTKEPKAKSKTKKKSEE